MSDESPLTPKPAVLPTASLARQPDHPASENTSTVRAGQILPWWCGCLAAMVCGLLMAAAFGPQPLHLLAWFAPVPFLVVLPRISAGQAWVFGMLLALVFYRLGMGWIISIGGYLGAAFMVIYAVWMGLSFRVTWLLMRRFGLAALVWAGPLGFRWSGDHPLRVASALSVRILGLGILPACGRMDRLSGCAGRHPSRFSAVDGIQCISRVWPDSM